MSGSRSTAPATSSTMTKQSRSMNSRPLMVVPCLAKACTARPLHWAWEEGSSFEASVEAHKIVAAPGVAAWAQCDGPNRMVIHFVVTFLVGLLHLAAKLKLAMRVVVDTHSDDDFAGAHGLRDALDVRKGIQPEHHTKDQLDYHATRHLLEWGCESKNNNNNNNGSASAGGSGPRKGMRNGGCSSYRGAVTGSNNRYPKFEGRCDDLKGYVFDLIGSRSADGYTKTVKEIADHVGQTTAVAEIPDWLCCISRCLPLTCLPTRPRIAVLPRNASGRRKSTVEPDTAANTSADSNYYAPMQECDANDANISNDAEDAIEADGAVEPDDVPWNNVDLPIEVETVSEEEALVANAGEDTVLVLHFPY